MSRLKDLLLEKNCLRFKGYASGQWYDIDCDNDFNTISLKIEFKTYKYPLAKLEQTQNAPLLARAIVCAVTLLRRFTGGDKPEPRMHTESFTRTNELMISGNQATYNWSFGDKTTLRNWSANLMLDNFIAYLETLSKRQN